MLVSTMSYANKATSSWSTNLHNPFENVAEESPLVSVLIPVHYSKTDKLVTWINQSKKKLLSINGVVISQSTEHRILVHDDKKHVQIIKKLVSELDKPRRIILLKARIVSVDNEEARDLGVLFQTHAIGSQSAVSNVNTKAGELNLPVANLGNGSLLDAKLSALEKHGHARVVTAPQLMTLNHQTATIEAGEEVPYQQETSNGGTSVAFKKAVMRLEVTPHALSAKRVLLSIHINQDKVSSLKVDGVPAIHTQQLVTQVELNSHATVAIGGIYETNQTVQHEGVPVLRHIPVLGFFFRSHHKLKDRRELLIFITAELLKS